MSRTVRHSPDFSRRFTRAAPLLALVFGVLPLAAVVSAAWQRMSWSDAPGVDYTALLKPEMIVPALVILAVVSYAWVRRHCPGRWGGPAVIVGLLSGGVWGLNVGVLPPEYATYQTPVAVIGSVIIVNRLAAWARRILVKPLTPELADSPLEIPVVARDCKEATFYLGTETFAVRVQRVRNNNNRRHHDDRMPLGEITSVRRVELLGGEPLISPCPEGARIPGATAGPAVTVTAGSREWVVPVDSGDADAVAAILQHRTAQVTAPAR